MDIEKVQAALKHWEGHWLAPVGSQNKHIEADESAILEAVCAWLNPNIEAATRQIESMYWVHLTPRPVLLERHVRAIIAAAHTPQGDPDGR